MRSKDKERLQFNRSQRIAHIDSHWYFKTREGDLLGPYMTVEEANQGIEVFLALIALDEVA